MHCLIVCLALMAEGSPPCDLLTELFRAVIGPRGPLVALQSSAAPSAQSDAAPSPPAVQVHPYPVPDRLPVGGVGYTGSAPVAQAPAPVQYAAPSPVAVQTASAPVYIQPQAQTIMLAPAPPPNVVVLGQAPAAAPNILYAPAAAAPAPVQYVAAAPAPVQYQAVAYQAPAAVQQVAYAPVASAPPWRPIRDMADRLRARRLAPRYVQTAAAPAPTAYLAPVQTYASAPQAVYSAPPLPTANAPSKGR